MQNHEYFRELSALAAIGQLSSDEDRELTQHLIDCESCREASEDYAHVVQHQLPQADPIRWKLRSLVPQGAPDSDVRDRFLARARAEGAEFTADVENAGRPKRRFRLGSGWQWQTVLATAAVTAVVTMSLSALALRERKAPVDGIGEAESRSAREQRALQTRITVLEETLETTSRKLSEGERSASLNKESLTKIQGELISAQDEARKLQGDLEKARSDYAALASADLQKDSLVANLRVQNEKEHKENAANLSTVVIQDARIRELSDSLEQQASNFERERQLMTASTDVRQLMGARNLHIMDVHDTDGAGKAAKSFGRVFYAEGESLIFYAFDLPSGKLTPAKYTFQAWGQRESVSHSVRNLGTFAVDDHEQHRWVLKVNDPKLLRGIDAVFVTAEVQGDTGEPRGKKILYAYIVGEANHP
jgi:hypothetical protein